MESEEKNNLEGKNNNEKWWLPAMKMFLRLSAWVAIPIILASFAGDWLDKRYGTEPWLLLALVGIAFIVSMIGLVKNTMEEYKKFNKENKNEDKKTNDS